MAMTPQLAIQPVTATTMKVTQHSSEFVDGTSREVTQSKIIHDNIVTWHRDRRKRESRIQAELREREKKSERRNFEKGFNALASAFAGKQVSA